MAGRRRGLRPRHARALAPLPVLLEYAAPLLRDGGALVAWKGDADAKGEETAVPRRPARASGWRAPVHALPGRRTERHLHLCRKLRPTPDRISRAVREWLQSAHSEAQRA